MSAHTPGPWATDGLTVYPRMILDAKIQPRICKVDSFHTGGGDRESNARLIAAAPELLEALRKAERHCPPNSEAEILARAAIAKSEGKT